ncbi:MAG: Ig-like domain-containing protein [Longimicrobiales bacterium]
MKKRHAVPVALTFLVVLTAAECEDTSTIVPVPSTLEVVSGDAQEAVVGTALTDPLVVQVLDQDDEPMAGVEVDWEAASGSIAVGGATDAAGEASAVWTLGTAAGPQTATASVEDALSTTFDATALAGELEQLATSADSMVFDALGDTAAVTATGTDAYDNPLTDLNVTWLSRDTQVAAVSAAGVVTAAGNGSTYVVGEAGALSDSVLVRVAQLASVVTVTPDTAILVVGDTADLVATAHDANGNAVASAAFTWSSSVEEVATVDSYGSVIGRAHGTALISAVVDDVADTATITVESDSGVVANPVCPGGADADLVGHWAAEEFWDEGVDAIAEGSRLLVSLWADSTGRIIQVRPFEVAPGDTAMATDSASIDWVGCSGQLTIDLVDQWIESEGGGFGSTEIDYSLSGDTLDLQIEAGGQHGTFVSVTTGELDADLMGKWVLVSDVFQNQNDPTQEVDAVAEDGRLVLLQVSGNGSLVHAEVDSTANARMDVGVWSVSGDTIVHYSMRDNAVIRMPYSKPAADRFVYERDDPEGWDFDDDGVDEPTTETGTFARPDTTGLVGTWVADSYVLTNVADTTQTVDLIDEGLSLAVTFTIEASYTSTFIDASGAEEVTSGMYFAAGGYLWLLEPDYVSFLELTYTATTATAVGSDSYDFDDDGVDEAATMEVHLTKQ